MQEDANHIIHPQQHFLLRLPFAPTQQQIIGNFPGHCDKTGPRRKVQSSRRSQGRRSPRHGGGGRGRREGPLSASRTEGLGGRWGGSLWRCLWEEGKDRGHTIFPRRGITLHFFEASDFFAT